MRSFILLLFLLSQTCIPAQDTLLAVYGTAVDILTKQPLKQLSVSCHQVADTSIRNDAVVAPDGSFMLGIFDPQDRIVVFDAPGYVPRSLLIDMDGPSTAQWKKGYGLSLEMSMYEEIPGLDLTMNGKPIGKGIYNREIDLFEWDRAYSRSMNERNKQLLKAYKQKVSGK